MSSQSVFCDNHFLFEWCDNSGHHICFLTMIITKDVLCLLAHLKPCLQEKKYFMDDSLLVEAIKKNEPNSFYKDALGQISTNPSIGKYLQSDAMRHLCNSFSQFVSVVNKDSQDYLYNDHGILNNERGLGSHEKIVIMIQLTMWSRLSIRCFKCICIAVQFFRRNINIGESELWSWLHSFTTCVSCSTSWVYDMYATALEKISFLSGVTVIHFNSSFSW